MTGRKGVLAVTLIAALVAASVVWAAPERTSKIQLAILLDTSNSMDGLIAQAKAKLWSIVNEFATTRKDGKAPEFEVALYEYGNSGLSRDGGYIRQVLPLTTDLDKVSQELFALRTNGGDEYCGAVIKAATEGLAWSASNEDLKVIFIAGNEPFTQGGVDFRKACPAAAAKGIIVNTIFCGNHEEGVRTNWRDGAVLADGRYMNIDQNAALVHIEAPQDAEIARLGVALNSTYIPFGAAGRAARENQAEQDRNAAALAPSVMTQRALSKSSVHYRNASWDLVDALAQKEVRLADIKDDDLPEAMRMMSLAEREKYVADQARQRSDIQAKIAALNAERVKYVAAEEKKLAASGRNTLDAAVIEAVKAQAAAKNFK